MKSRIIKAADVEIATEAFGDPVFPVEHGETLAAAVPGARLVRLEGGGHELHKADWDTIIGALVEHTDRRKN